MKTEIKAFSRKNGTLAFHCEEPRLLSGREIAQELRAWCVDHDKYIIQTTFTFK